MNSSLSRDNDYALWSLLAQASHALYQAREKELRKFGISAMQARALFIIQAIGERPTPAEISRWMSRRPHSISDLLSRMEKQGLVRKVKDLDRKNLIRIVLTEKGQQASHQSAQRESLHKVMSILSQEEHQQLALLLRRLRDKTIEEFGLYHKPPFP